MIQIERIYVRYKLSGRLDSRRFWNQQKIKNKSLIQAFRDRFQLTTEEYEHLLKKHSHVQRIKSKYLSKKQELMKFGLFEFYCWYIKQITDGQVCCYCGVRQEDAVQTKIYMRSKRSSQRGKSIELERVVAFPKKANLYSPSNCRLACYVCNNAKSDFLSVQDFYPIAVGINQMWREKLSKQIIMPSEIYLTFKDF